MIGKPTSNSGKAVFVVGVLFMVVAVPLGCVALLFAGGGEMIAFESRTDLLRTATSVAFPLLMFGAGAALLRASRSGRYGLAVAISLLMAVDFAALAFVTWLQAQPEPPVNIPQPDPDAVIKPAVLFGGEAGAIGLVIAAAR